MPTSTLTDVIRDPANNVVATSPGTTVNFRLMANGSPTPGFRISDGINVASLIVTSATTTGTISQALEQNSNIVPGGTYYVVEILCPSSQGGTQEWALLSSSSASPQTFRQAQAAAFPAFTPITTVPTNLLAGNNVFTGTNTFTGPTNITNLATAQIADPRVWIDIRETGADPTGAIDSTSAIQAAVNAVAASRGVGVPDGGATSQTGGTVFIPAGNFKVTSQISVPKGVSIVGTCGRWGQAEDVAKQSTIWVPFGTTVSGIFNVVNSSSISGLNIEIYSGTGFHILVQDKVAGDDQAGGIGVWNCALQGGVGVLQIIGFGGVSFRDNAVVSIGAGYPIMLGGGTLGNHAVFPSGNSITNIQIRDNIFNLNTQGVDQGTLGMVETIGGINNDVAIQNFVFDGNWSENILTVAGYTGLAIGSAGSTNRSTAVTISNNYFGLSNRANSNSISVLTCDAYKQFGNTFNNSSRPWILDDVRDFDIGTDSYFAGPVGAWGQTTSAVGICKGGFLRLPHNSPGGQWLLDHPEFSTVLYGPAVTAVHMAARYRQVQVTLAAQSIAASSWYSTTVTSPSTGVILPGSGQVSAFYTSVLPAGLLLTEPLWSSTNATTVTFFNPTGGALALSSGTLCVNYYSDLQ